jgi:hypothetical protein
MHHGQVGDDLDLAYGAQIAASSGARVVLCVGAIVGAEAGALLTAIAQVRLFASYRNGLKCLSSFARAHAHTRAYESRHSVLPFEDCKSWATVLTALFLAFGPRRRCV